jgi:phosphate ABC transporter phosphate-binding protein
MTRLTLGRGARYLAVLVTLGLIGMIAALPAQAATNYVAISGAGSTWSANAISAWVADVHQFGMTVNYASSGSSDGRTQFANNTVDFGVSEIPYGLTDNGHVDTPPARKYAYMPIVAGGTSFMYNLKIGSKRVDNLRLSGATIAGIFTGNITKWSDPAIKADNPALALPARKIIPVVRSDGSGTTAQFSLWMSKKYPAVWNAYCAKAGRASSPCGVTSQFPTVPGSNFTAQSGSLGVSGYVKADSSDGAITYVEYSYPLNLNFPVVKVLNASGYYTLPTASNVAVGLLKATINKDKNSSNYLTQNLDGVYANSDRRTYPLSSYSYMIIPTDNSGSFSTAKGATLGAFAKFFLCEGQQQAENLGYSPLPINLVTAGLDQVKEIGGADKTPVKISTCHNPTVGANGTNALAKSAPYPPSCDKQGTTQCTDSTAGHITSNSGSSSSGSGNGGNTNSGTGDSGTGGTGTGGAGTGTAGPTSTDGTTPTGGAIDPDTGQPIGSTGNGATGSDVTALPVSLTSGYVTTGTRNALMGLAIVLLLAVAVGPPLISRTLVRRRGR